jgi:trans-aconitate methyltransferase
MSIIARQFAHPHGLLGRVIGHGMARRNAEFSRWVMQEVSEHYPDDLEKIAELGPGPGVGLQEALRRFRGARVWGIDPSPEMLAQSRKRNLADVQAGRLALVQGSVACLAEIAPVDAVVANHVLYFWHQPAGELTAIRGCLRHGGLLALGYQLRQNMPPMAQRHFPQQGHLLYESDEDVARLLRSAGFSAVSHQVKGPPAAPEGRVALATA